MYQLTKKFNEEAFVPQLSEKEQKAAENILSELKRSNLSLVQINKVLYSIDTELYKNIVNRSLNQIHH